MSELGELENQLPPPPIGGGGSDPCGMLCSGGGALCTAICVFSCVPVGYVSSMSTGENIVAVSTYVSGLTFF